MEKAVVIVVVACVIGVGIVIVVVWGAAEVAGGVLHEHVGLLGCGRGLVVAGLGALGVVLEEIVVLGLLEELACGDDC